MSDVQKLVGDTATITATVRNSRGVALDVPVTFTSDLETVNVTDARDATLVGNAVETVTITATASNGVSGSATVDFIEDTTPATVEVAVS